jgi:mono/diheme cytochrome c family protein
MKAKTGLFVFILSGGFILFLGGWSAQSATDDPAYSRGEQLYAGYCAICHGARGDGRGDASPSFGSDRPVDFTTPDFWKGHSDSSIIKVIRKGKGRMPASNLTEEEGRVIVQYMHRALKDK